MADEIDYSHCSETIAEWFVNLDDCVVSALELLSKSKIPRFDFSHFQRPFVAGSGNAIETGKILFQGIDAVFGDESNYEIELQKPVDGVVVISASGGKDSPAISAAAKEKGIEAFLFTCNPNAPAVKYFERGKVLVFPKEPEIYTYNTSTYLGMILGKTNEDAGIILKHIREVIDPLLIPDFSDFKGFYFMIPKKFHGVKKMFQIKFEELFGRRVGRDFYTPEFARNHATDIVRMDDELTISIGHNNQSIGRKRLNLPLPENADYGTMMAVGYYVIGRIQRQHYPWFREGIVPWCKERGIEPIVR